MQANPDTISDINPLKMPSLIWEYMHPYMEKYNILFTQQAPELPVNRNTIVWSLNRRTPGGGDDSSVRKTARYLGREHTTESMVKETHMMYYTLDIEYKIFGRSSSQLDDIAWDFENALLAVKGTINNLYTGFHIKFLEQKTDMLDRKSSSSEYRILMFRLVVPVRYFKYIREIKQVRLELWSGRLAAIDEEFVYDGTGYTRIPLQDYQRVSDIVNVKRNYDAYGDVELTAGIDYIVVQDEDNASKFIQWKTSGAVPEAGETFWITYLIQDNDSFLTI